MGTFRASWSQSQARVPAPKCCSSASPTVRAAQLQGHGEGRQALAAAQGGSHSQEGARGSGEHRLPSLSPQTQLDGHPTAGDSAWGEEAGAAPNGKGGRPKSSDTLQQWHRGGHSG